MVAAREVLAGIPSENRTPCKKRSAAIRHSAEHRPSKLRLSSIRPMLRTTARGDTIGTFAT